MSNTNFAYSGSTQQSQEDIGADFFTPYQSFPEKEPTYHSPIKKKSRNSMFVIVPVFSFFLF